MEQTRFSSPPSDTIQRYLSARTDLGLNVELSFRTRCDGHVHIYLVNSPSLLLLLVLQSLCLANNTRTRINTFTLVSLLRDFAAGESPLFNCRT